MIAKNKIFIGREQQLERFKGILHSELEKRIIFVYDAVEDKELKGGIGKTWLLDKFISLASSDEFKEKYLVIDEVFDFLEPVNQDRFSRLLKLVQLIDRKLQTDHFKPFNDLVQKYYYQQTSLEAMLDVFYECYNKFCSDTKKKIIRCYDSFENSTVALKYYRGKYGFICDEIGDNSLVVICGRVKPDYNLPVWEGRENSIEEMPLTGFSLPEAIQFFVNEGIIGLGEENIKIINTKAEGRPILLALAADLLKNKVKTVDDIIKVSGERFKEELVSFIRDYNRPPMDQVTLAMAHLKHRCNKDILRTYIGDQVKDYDSFFKQLSQLSFIRPISFDGSVVVLHDEMQKMVSNYIFRISDAANIELRRELSDLVIKSYYEKEISNKESEIVQRSKEGKLAEAQTLREEIAALKSEMWYHKLFLDYKNNVDRYLFDLFDQSLEDGKLDYCLLLLAQMEDLDNLIEFESYFKNKLKFRKIRVYSALLEQTGNPFYFESAESIIKELELEVNKVDWQHRFSGTIYQDKGILRFYVARLRDAEQFFKKSVEALIQDADKENLDVHYIIGKSYNWYGYNQYQQGFFSESIKLLKLAEEHFQLANKLIETAEIPDVLKDFRQRQIYSWLATARGNLCRIYHEVEDLELAAQYGESSLIIQRKLKAIINIVRGLNALGLVYSRGGRFTESQKFYQEAESILKTNPHKVLEARIKINMATSLFKRDQFSNLLERCDRSEFESEAKNIKINTEDFHEAQNLLEYVIDQMLPLRSRELTVAYLNLGELLFLNRKWEESKKNLQDGEKFSRLRNDSYTFLNILQRIVLVNYYQQNEDELQESANRFENEIKKLKNLEETGKYIVRFYLIMGSFQFEKAQKIFEAKRTDKDIIKIYTNAFQYFAMAYLNAKNYAPERLKLLTYDLYRRRFSLLLESSINTVDEIIDILKINWQKLGLEANEFENIAEHYNFYKRIESR